MTTSDSIGVPERPDRYDYLPRAYDARMPASVSQLKIAATEEAIKTVHLAGLLTASNWKRAAIVTCWVDTDLRAGSGDPDSLSVSEFCAMELPGLRSERTVRSLVRAWREVAGEPRPAKGGLVRIPSRPFPSQAELDALRPPREVFSDVLNDAAAKAAAGGADTPTGDPDDRAGTTDEYNAERLRTAVLAPLDQVTAVSEKLTKNVAALDLKPPFDNLMSAVHSDGPLIWPIYQVQADAIMTALGEAGDAWSAARDAVADLFSRSGFVTVVDGTVDDVVTPAGELTRMRRELESSRNPDGSRRVPSRAPRANGAIDVLRELVRTDGGPWTTRELADMMRITRQTAHTLCEKLFREGVLARQEQPTRYGGNLYGRPDKLDSE